MQFGEQLVKCMERMESTNRNECKMKGNGEYELVPITLTYPAPNRLAGFDSFLIDSKLFLDSVKVMTNIVNINSLAVANNQINAWNMGKFSESGTTPFPTFSVYTGRPDDNIKPSLKYVSDLDKENLYYKDYGERANTIVSWFRNIKTIRGNVDVFSNTFSTIQLLSSPPTRVMGEVEFNTKASLYSTSMRSHTQSIANLKTQYDNFLNGSYSCGRVTDKVTEVISCGRVTDKVFEN